MNVFGETIYAYLGGDYENYKSVWTKEEFEKIVKKYYPLTLLDKNNRLVICSNWSSLERDYAEGKVDYLYIPTINVFNNDKSICVKKIKKLQEINKSPIVIFVLENISTLDSDMEKRIMSFNGFNKIVRFFRRCIMSIGIRRK